MKKHPVDDLSKGKLIHSEKQPSAGAWIRIVNEQKNKPKKYPVRIWYAAASILIAFFAGYLVWEGNIQAPNGKDMLAITEQTDKKPQPVDDASKREEAVITINDDPIKPTTGRAPKNALGKVKSVETGPVVQEYAESLVAETYEKHEEPQVEQLAAKYLKDEENIELKSIVPAQEKMLIGEAKTVDDKVQEQNRTIIVHVALPVSELEEQRKVSKFSKVFRQLKNARAGEPVDWGEVGFNPKAIIAKVDGKSGRDEGIEQ